MKQLPKIIVIGGTTCSGKSAAARKIAALYNGEIVNADSRQLYTRLDIGTAKDPIEVKNKDGSCMIEGIRHHLFDCIDPGTQYNLARYQKDARRTISMIQKKGALPILVGGTGLYLDAVVYNYEISPEETSLSLRGGLRSRSIDELQKLLISKYPERFHGMTGSDKKNAHRLIRAIERPGQLSSSATTRKSPLYSLLYLVLNFPANDLRLRIHERIEHMFTNGLEEENQMLRSDGITTDLPSMKTIGYQEFDAYFAGDQPIEETKRLVELHTIQYTKRQLTWFRRNKEAIWISTQEEAIDHAKRFLSSSR